MKQILTYIQAAFSSITFKKALSLSFFFHIALVGCMAYFVDAFQVSNLYKSPLIFDFVFAPKEEYRNSDINKIDQNKSQVEPEEDGFTQQPPQPMQPRLKEEAILAEEKLIDKVVDTENSSLEEFTDIHEPNYIPESQNPVLSKNLYALNELDPAELSMPTAGRDISKIVPAKISMSEKQIKMLNKKFREWAEDFHKMELPDSTLFWEHKGEHYKATFTRKPAQNNMDMDEVAVRIETEKNGVELSSEMKMKRLAFSNYAQFVDYWDPRVAVHNDELEGRFHSNSQINVNNGRGVTPKFHGKVTTSSWDVINTANRMPFFREESIFLGGLETGVKPIKLPKNLFPFISEADTSLSQVYRINEDARIVFKSDGSFTVTKLKTQKKRRIKITQDVCYIFGSNKAKLYLRGVVKGRVLVYASNNIIIDDDLTYVNHPLTSNVANDYLGLLSEKNIEIAHPDVTGKGDLSIFASIYAKRKFVVRHLRGSGDDTLYIYGSLAAGSLSATEPRYATHITFDKRLERYRPPSFPMTNRYEVSQFEPEWKLKNEN